MTVHMSLNLMIELQHPKQIVSEIGSIENCDLNCEIKIHRLFLVLLTESLLKVLKTPLSFQLSYRQQNLSPEVTPIMANNGLVKLLTACDAGFEIKKGTTLCGKLCHN